MDAAPDLITAVIGFRQFRVLGDELWSARADYLWDRGPHTAVCLAGHHTGDEVPAKGCTCGFYARYTPPPRTASATTTDLVAGAVALWGRIELHAHGMRARHASVVALALPLSRWGKRRRTIAAAERLGVPAVPARRLVTATLDAGRIIPKEMRPPDVMPNKRQAPGEPAPARLNIVADGLEQKKR